MTTGLGRGEDGCTTLLYAWSGRGVDPSHGVDRTSRAAGHRFPSFRSDMRALIHDPDAPAGVRLGVVPEPAPRDDQALIQVHAASLNFVDVAFMAERARAGAVLGMDAAGVVVKAAADGSGPPPGARVVGF